jgi:hypothetical protein
MAASHPASRIGTVLGCRPLRWIGVRSYGLYLWHFPIVVLTTPPLAGPNLLRGALQVGASIGIAGLSWRYLESPIRQGALGRLWRHLRAEGWRRAAPREGVVALGMASLLILGCAAVGGVTAGHGTPTSPVATASRTTPSPSATPSVTPTPPAVAAATPAAAPTPPPPQTSCTSVVHIGDSTSESLVSPDYLPDPTQRLPAQYQRVGVANPIMQIEGATSVVETLPGEPNASDLAKNLIAQGYKGCWVIALGTNDAADVYVGSSVSLQARIEQMMSVIGNEPVMWVTAASLQQSGPYSEANMQQWNQAIRDAAPHHPNMRVYDWAAVAQAQPDWFVSDGVHYTSVGSANRAADIANALATAFPPKRGHPSGRGR